MPLLFLVAALLIDWLAYRRQQRQKGSFDILPAYWVLGIIIALAAVLIPPLLVTLVDLIPGYTPFPTNVYTLQPSWREMLLPLPLALIMGGLIAQGAKVFGDIWYMNRR